MFRLFEYGAIAITLVGASSALAQNTHGVAGYFGGDTEWGSYSNAQLNFTQDQFPNGTHYNTFTGSVPFSASASDTLDGASAGFAISATPKFGNVGLHGSAEADLSGGLYELSGAGAGFDLYAFDTFHIGGDAGTPEQFQYTITLDSSANTTMDIGNTDATRAYGGLELFANSSWIEAGTVLPNSGCSQYNGSYYYDASGNPCGLIAGVTRAAGALNEPDPQTMSGVLELMGGSTVELGEMLWSRVFVSQDLSGTATFDASNTGWFTLTPLTQGATFTTDSGLTYANSPDTRGAIPEPATWAMMLLGFGGVGIVARAKRKGVHLRQPACA